MDVKLGKALHEILDQHMEPLKLSILYPVNTRDLPSKKFTVGEDSHVTLSHLEQLLKAHNERTRFSDVIGGLTKGDRHLSEPLSTAIDDDDTDPCGARIPPRSPVNVHLDALS